MFPHESPEFPYDEHAMGQDELLQCTHLLIVATRSEQEQLARAATDLGLPFAERKGRTTTYFDLGAAGPGRVLALRTAEGPFSFGGSAAQAIYSRLETQAVGGMIGVGTCFGVDRATQAVGDVIVSSALVPYDNRNVLSDGLLPRFRYHRVTRHPAKASLRAMLERSRDADARDFKVHFGALLSGGSHIACRSYRDHLVSMLTKVAEDTIVGGEMEGVGLLGLSARDRPEWVVVKGISDFADEDRATDAPAHRERASYHAARFVLEALQAERSRVAQEASP